MLAVKVNIDANGRIPIPTKLRSLLNLKKGDELIMKYEDNQLTISSYENNLKTIQDLVKKYTNRSLVESLEELRNIERNNG